jgi:hypothetical protein
MKVSWVFGDRTVLDPTVDLNQIKNVGPVWGSWRTWRACHTDNVICHDLKKAQELMQREFYAKCNFYVPESMWTELERPPGVKLYQGDFVHDVPAKEEIIAMHLASVDSDIVLLMGMDFSAQATLPDRLQEHQSQNYRGLTKQIMIDCPEIQWVAVDHAGEFRKDLLMLDNLTKDSLDNVFDMLLN